MMKIRFAKYMAIVLTGIVCSCSDDNSLPEVTPADRGTVFDNEGNEYGWVRIGDQMWTTGNAKNGTPLSEAEYYNNFGWSYVLGSDKAIEDFETSYLPKYGNPVTLDDAIANAPEGWRVPTDEDWQKLENALGMKDTASKGFRGDGVAFAMMAKDSGSRLGLDFGGGVFPQQVFGWIEMNVDYVDEYAYYWTSTVNPDYDREYELAYFRKIVAGYGAVARDCMRTDSYLNVRWVKDAE